MRKEVMNLKEQDGVYGRAWEEEKEEGNDAIKGCVLKPISLPQRLAISCS